MSLELQFIRDCLADVIAGYNDHQPPGLDKVEYRVSEKAGPTQGWPSGWEAAPYRNGLKATRLCYKS